ncbi:MAG: alpha-L-arabinofuranosidase C-terminal domain-containing protein [Candidatus Acidiferrales bacterium]|jgi:alpha-N-arabinofuranosidase
MRSFHRYDGTEPCDHATNKLCFVRSACALAILLVLAATTLFAQQNASIEIDTHKIVHAVPRTIFGGFMEPLRSAIYGGGIWAQLLENPSFEENLWSADALTHIIQWRPELGRSSRIGLPIPWESLFPQGSRFEPRWGDAANSSRSLLIMGLPGKQTGVRQAIYPPVHRELRYTGSIWAKPVSGEKRIEISLRRRDHPDEIFAMAPIDLTAGWKRYEYSLELSKGQLASREPADFVVAVTGDTRVLIDQALFFPADNVDGLNPEAIEFAKALKMPTLRFGGNFTSGYHWRDGVGPMDKRVSMLNTAWGQPEYNQFGTDEFLEFAKLVGAQPLFCLNMGSGTVQEAVDWVKYVNARWGDKSGGLLWELGNELWGLGQIGYPVVDDVAKRTREFSAAVRKVDRRATFIATGADPDRYKEWNAAQLTSGPGFYEYLSTHLVVNSGLVQKPDASPELLAESLFGIPVGIERMMREMKVQIDADPRMKSVKLALTENLFRAPFAPSPPDYPTPHIPEYRNLGGAIYEAGMLNMLMRVADITPISHLTGAVEFGRLWEKRGITYVVPTYWVLRMYSNADVANLLKSKVDVARYDVHQGSPRDPDVTDVPYLDVAAVSGKNGDAITLFVVNRGLDSDITASIKLPGFTLHSAAGQVLSAPDIYMGNDDAQPDAVVPKQITENVSGSAFSHTFPKGSVTVIEVR